ncbi:MAG TPA: hypothetical protein VFJ58_08560 [Armatimonadota bacterium]|nr:hypothetical protein [Armatimonadota bacterium]
MNKTRVMVGVKIMLAACALVALARPAVAIPDASTPTLLGVTLGGELGVAGQGVGSSAIPYYLYGQGGLARLLAVKGELLGGGHRPTMKLLTAEFAELPTPLLSVSFEPGIVSFRNSVGPTLGLRATVGTPIKLRATGYARVHFVESQTTTEFGAGVDYPIANMLRLSVSAIHFDGGSEPAGTLFLAGLKLHVGI